MGIRVRKLAGHVGAEIDGLALNQIDDTAFATLQDALFEHGVVVLRGQSLDPDAHVHLAERFGEIDVNRFFTPVPKHPQIAEVRTAPGANKVIGGTWHTDHSYDAKPAMVSILVARDLPPYGGDTLFASQVAALDTLSDGMRDMLEGLYAWHSDESFQGSPTIANVDADSIKGGVRHPVVIAHPQTGRAALYVNGDFTTHFDGWTIEESAPLLSYLYAHASRPEISCRITWTPGSVVIWDNRLVQHHATADYPGHHRLMHRITVKGQPLAAAKEAA